MDLPQRTQMIVSPDSPGTFLTQGYYGKKKKSEKSDEKKENKEWDTGFGELYEKIDDRKVKKQFKSMDEIIKEDF
jgi:hypothetical protein